MMPPGFVNTMTAPMTEKKHLTTLNTSVLLYLYTQTVPNSFTITLFTDHIVSLPDWFYTHTTINRFGYVNIRKFTKSVVFFSLRAF